MIGRFAEYLDLLEDEGCNTDLLATSMRDLIDEAERLEAINAELVGALQDVLAWPCSDEDSDSVSQFILDRARAAIAKTKGTIK